MKQQKQREIINKGGQKENHFSVQNPPGLICTHTRSQARGTSTTGTLSKKGHKQQAVISNTWNPALPLTSGQDEASFPRHPAMTGLQKSNIQTRRANLLVRRQCDIQIADGGLRHALAGFWFFQKGEASAGLLTHISDLKPTEEE